MKTVTKNNLNFLFHMLRSHRTATAVDRRNVLRVMRDDDLQDEFLARVRERFDINVDNLRALLELIVEYAPQLLKIVADVIALFAK